MQKQKLILSGSIALLLAFAGWVLTYDYQPSPGHQRDILNNELVGRKFIAGDPETVIAHASSCDRAVVILHADCSLASVLAMNTIEDFLSSQDAESNMGNFAIHAADYTGCDFSILKSAGKD